MLSVLWCVLVASCPRVRPRAGPLGGPACRLRRSSRLRRASRRASVPDRRASRSSRAFDLEPSSPGDFLVDRRPVGLRKIDAASISSPGSTSPTRAAFSVDGADWATLAPAPRAAVRGARRRVRVPVPPSSPRAHGRGERGAAAVPRGRPRSDGRRDGARSCSTAWAFSRGAAAFPRTLRAANGSASPSRAPWCGGPGSSSATSRRAASTPRACGRRSSTLLAEVAQGARRGRDRRDPRPGMRRVAVLTIEDTLGRRGGLSDVVRTAGASPATLRGRRNGQSERCSRNTTRKPAGPCSSPGTRPRSWARRSSSPSTSCSASSARARRSSRRSSPAST